MSRGTKPRQDIADMLRAGATYRHIQQQLHVSPNCIALTRKTLDIPVPSPRHRNRIHPDTRKTIITMIKKGRSVAQIIRRTGVSKATIGRIRRDLRIQGARP
ncbi:helix-turn-helix domain-containing protein [Streptomyces sp. NPDC050988]|uniref:helix-turn-helix domain-containing protein n=1 Tax=Streptomyces sp. NPDC050988 TaxID=3365637 RepID=UPI0037B8B7BE